MTSCTKTALRECLPHRKAAASGFIQHRCAPGNWLEVHRPPKPAGSPGKEFAAGSWRRMTSERKTAASGRRLGLGPHLLRPECDLSGLRHSSCSVKLIEDIQAPGGGGQGKKHTDGPVLKNVSLLLKVSHMSSRYRDPPTPLLPPLSTSSALDSPFRKVA